MEGLLARIRSWVGPGRKPRSPRDFEEIFGRFRAVLDHNTRSLEIITEMGEVLGGDYLFDIQYVRRAYGQLAGSLREGLARFDELTAGRHRRLQAVYDRIDGEIRRVIDDTPRQPVPLVVWPDDADGSRAEAVGGKMANLAALRRIPVAVPDAFTLSTSAFESFLRHNHLREKISRLVASPESVPSQLEEIRESILHGDMPQDLARELGAALRKLQHACDRNCVLAVRSSAGDEDGEHSFAGQFQTVLNVPPDPEAVARAYRKVIASAFTEHAVVYQQHMGYDPARTAMAVGCMTMVDAAASGVLYSSAPDGDPQRIVINAAWGLGVSVVDGTTDADHIIVAKDGSGTVIEQRVGEKRSMVGRSAAGGTEALSTPDDVRRQPCLTGEQIKKLAAAALVIEQRFERPQDIEWAYDSAGRLTILQSRPLRMQTAAPAVPAADRPVAAERIILKNSGYVVQRGAAAGPVFVVKRRKDLDEVPRGAVLISRHDASDIVRVMPRISAILTDTGAPTSHMASLAREFRVPTVVNTGDATKALAPGTQVTVVAGENGAAVYEGIHQAALAAEKAGSMEDVAEFRKKRFLLRSIVPLNLVDPLRDDFTPEACRTIHDILRFMHEQAVACLIDSAGFGTKSQGAIELALPIPAGIKVIDIGGGLQDGAAGGRVGPEQLASEPFSALVRGMTHPGAWRSEAVPLSVNDFMTSMFRAPDIVADAGRRVETSVAVISRDYVNLNFKFGYHFILLDCYASERPKNNHIYFRFAGGATDLTKRSRRLRLIGAILEDMGFTNAVRGDMIIARLANIRKEEMTPLLEGLGRLISFTRQLDAVLSDDRDVEQYARNFLDGRFEPGSARDVGAS